jgi:hypothetical protein
MSYPGMEYAVIRYFQSSSFEMEKFDRTSRLLRNMSFPVQLLQGDCDDASRRYYAPQESRNSPVSGCPLCLDPRRGPLNQSGTTARSHRCNRNISQ